MKWRSTSRQGRRPFTGWPSRGDTGIQAGRHLAVSSQRAGSLDCRADSRENAGQDMSAPKTIATRRPRPERGCTSMNAVEIEQAITDLAEQPFDRAEFPMPFLRRSATKRPPSSACARGVEQVRPRRCSPDQQYPHPDLRRRAGDTDAGRSRPARRRPRPRRSSSSPPTVRTSRPKTWPAVRPSPVPSKTFPTTSASSCRWRASVPSARSAKTPSTFGPPAA